MLCPRFSVQGGLASMRQKTSKSKFPHPYIGVRADEQQLVSKKKDGQCRPFYRSDPNYSEKYISYSTGCTDMR
jgi:hypothetical protein